MSEIPIDLKRKDCPSFLPSLSNVRVISVYDGDTVTVAGTVGGIIYKFPVRLNGIDTPERRCGCAKRKGTWSATERKRLCVEEHRLANVARKSLQDRILRKVVRIEVSKTKEKYGRLLAELFYEGESVNEWLIAKGHAKRYQGGSKTFFT
jgi:endonuclease YncB( thermonuclease family)